jgi:tetratricopeptide (TPR) repeat protein
LRGDEQTLAVQLTPEGGDQMGNEYTNSAAAWAAFVLGMQHYRKYTKEDNARAREYFQRAVDLDQTFVRAHANLAATYRQEWTFVWTDNHADLDNIKQKALTKAKRAVDLARTLEGRASSLPYALQQLAYVYMYSDRLGDAINTARDTINLNPQYADGHAALAQMLIYAGEPRQALAHMEVAKSLNQNPPAYYHYHIGQAYYMLGVQEGNKWQFVTAIGLLQKALEMSDNFRPARAYLVAAYQALGLVDEARAEMQKLQAKERDHKLFNDPQRVAPYGGSDANRQIGETLLRAWRDAGG